MPDKSALSKAYTAAEVEPSIYQTWETSGYFNPDTLDAKGPAFTIALPPPNATGVLHIGHAFMLALQDLMIRYHRMKGDKTLWIPGTDHASIATQSKVEQIITKEGHTRAELGRTAFLERVHEFVEQSQSTIRSQIRVMGSSCDWSRECYTLDEQRSKAVREMFVQMYEDGLIYRGNRIVHWCPQDTSAISDDEVNHKEMAGKLYHLRYPIKGTDKTVIVATTRPETLFGDVAIAVNPNDARYKDLIGGIALLPINNKEIPIIADEYVDPTFGTGVLKITPAHDPNDFTLGEKYHLAPITVIDEHGKTTLKNIATEYTATIQHFEGMDRFAARERVISDLTALDRVEKIEDHPHAVGTCDRCGTVIEPLISLQWFIDVNKKIEKYGKSLKELCRDAVESNETIIIPERFKKTYFHWIDNLRDWCISRQIWFGHQIPVWYCEKSAGGCGETIVARETPSECPRCKHSALRRDEDTFDTWFSSGLWTFSTLGWPGTATKNPDGSITKAGDLATFHPTAVLETGYDILFFWVARMIMLTTYALGEVPFKQVYLHGLILDKNGKKMSKSKEETVVNPIDVVARYGADALRLSMISGVTPGNDLRLSEEKIEGCRNFVNKLWNISRFILDSIAAEEAAEHHDTQIALTLSDQWIITRLRTVFAEVTKAIEASEFSHAAETLRSFTTDDLADWYLEIAKVEGHKAPLLRGILETLLRLWHPILPFVTEHIYGYLHSENPDRTLLMIAPWHAALPEFAHNSATEEQFNLIKSTIQWIRNARMEHKIPASQKLHAVLYAPYRGTLLRHHEAIIMRLARLELLTLMEAGEKPVNTIYGKVKDIEIFLPLAAEQSGEEAARLDKEIASLTTALTTLQARLADPEFTAKAPEKIVAIETAKVTEYQEKLAKLISQRHHLS